MSDTVYRVAEIVGSARESLEDAITGAVERASSTLRNVDWFEVSEIRGHVENGHVAHYQVGLKVGFAVEDTKG
jgi:dodecin